MENTVSKRKENNRLMDLYISASGIKDFLSCSVKYYFRRYFKDRSKQNDPMAVGSIVHSVVENEWKSEELALKLAKKEKMCYNISENSSKRSDRLVKNFFKYFASGLSDDDIIEMNFNIPLEDGVFAVGKLDRVMPSSGRAVDWKTGSKDPTTLSYDPQFIYYNWAYKQLFGKYPNSLEYASLTTGKIIQYKHYEINENILMNNIIPHMIKRIRKGDFIYDGRLKFGYICTHCNFKEFCWDELASRNTTFG